MKSRGGMILRACCKSLKKPRIGVFLQRSFAQILFCNDKRNRDDREPWLMTSVQWRTFK